MVKNQSVMQETQVQNLGWEDALEEGMATHSSVLAWRIPMDRGAWWATVHGVTGSDRTERLSSSSKCGFSVIQHILIDVQNLRLGRYLL